MKRLNAKTFFGKSKRLRAAYDRNARERETAPPADYKGPVVGKVGLSSGDRPHSWRGILSGNSDRSLKKIASGQHRDFPKGHPGVKGAQQELKRRGVGVKKGSSKAQLGGGRWVTMNGEHVFIGGK